MRDFFLLHPAAPLILPWLLGSVAAAWQRRWPTALLLAALAALGVAGLWPHAATGWVAVLLDLHGVRVDVQWAALAVLLLAALPRGQGVLGWRSLLPLAIVSWQGAGAALAAVGVAASGTLERGQPRRLLLAVALLGMTAAAAVDANSLTLWASGRRMGVSIDNASTAVDALEQGLRAGGWVAGMAYATPPTAQRQA